MMRAPLVALLVLAVVSELEAEPEEAEDQCIWYDICGWDQDYGEDGGNQVHFLNCHYEGPRNGEEWDRALLLRSPYTLK